MTAAQIATVARFITNTNSTTVSDANFLRMLSERHKQMVVKLGNLLENYNLVQGAASLTANAEALASAPLDIIKIKRMEVQWASGGTFYPVTFMDMNESDYTQDQTTTNSKYSSTQPYAVFKGTSILMRPIPTVSVLDAAKIFYLQMPTDFASTNETPSVPAEYHRLLADLVAIDIRMMKAELNPITALQEEGVIWQYLGNQVTPRVSGQYHIAKAAYENYE